MNEDKNKKEEKPHILVVEDSQTDVEILLESFVKYKFPAHIHIVGDGEDALNYLENKGVYADKKECPQPDIIILDVMLPKMDGHTFVRTLRLIDQTNTIPIIVFSSKRGLKPAFRIEGVDNYVVKSLDPKDLIEKIKELLAFDEFTKKSWPKRRPSS